jgi:TolB protein
MRGLAMKKLMIVTLIMLAAMPAMAQRLRIVVGGPNFRPYPVAAPDLIVTGGGAAAGDVARELSNLLQFDLDLTRSLELVPPKTYLNPDKEPWTRPVFTNWVNVGASGLVRGGVDSDGQRVSVTLRFFDVQAQREGLTRTCQATRKTASRCVHQFVDDLVELLTGEKGVFSSRIAYVKRVGKNKQIYACDVDGGNIAPLVDNTSLNLLPAWGPMGKLLYFTSFLHGNPDMYRINLETHAIETVSAAQGVNTGASVSPDGKKLALTISTEGNAEIYTMDVDGKNLTKLTDSWGQDVSPTWSPDGTRIAFVSSRSGNPHIYVMGADGSNPRRLTFQGTYNQEPDWSPRPDGQIVFTARDEQLKYDIFLVHPDSGQITRLTQDQGNNESPSHSPDGHHLTFTSTRGPEHVKELWVIDVDGNNPRRIVSSSTEIETPSWGPRLGYN